MKVVARTPAEKQSQQQTGSAGGGGAADLGGAAARDPGGLLEPAKVQKAIAYNRKRYPGQAQVVALQQQLGAASSGSFDEPTVQQVAVRQQTGKLTVDGKIGPKTEAALGLDPDASGASAPAAGGEVAPAATPDSAQADSAAASPAAAASPLKLGPLPDGPGGLVAQPSGGVAGGTLDLATLEQTFGQMLAEKQAQDAQTAAAPEPQKDAEQAEPVQKEPPEGLTPEAIEQKLPEAVPVEKSTTPEEAKKYVATTGDAKSLLPADVAKLYDDCVKLAKAGKLCFPGAEKKGVSSAAFVKFRNALYKFLGEKYGTKERRINKEITSKKGGKKAYDIRSYILTTLSPIPADLMKKGKSGKFNTKGLAKLEEMAAAAAKEGAPLKVISAYRAPSKNKKTSNPKAVASNSSHSYGLAIDFSLSVDATQTSTGKAYQVTDASTKDMNNFMKYYGSDVTKWLLVNAAKFDFYPYANEPWHYEYNPVGMADEIIAGAAKHGKK